MTPLTNILQGKALGVKAAWKDSPVRIVDTPENLRRIRKDTKKYVNK